MSGLVLRNILPEKALSPSLYEGDTELPSFTGQEIGIKKLNRGPAFQLGSFNAPLYSELVGGPTDFTSSNNASDYETSSTAEKALQFLSNKVGKNITLKEVSPFTDKATEAYFQSQGPGGSTDPENRYLYVKPTVPYSVLFHEAGHAGDPILATREETFDPRVVTNLNDPATRLGYVFEHLGKSKVKSETEAQSFVGRNLPAFAKQNPQLNTGAQRFTDSSYFKEYPASYANNALNTFYQSELGGSARPVVEEDADQGVALRVFNSSPTKALDFALNPSLQQKENEIKDWTRQYIDTRLNQFQTTPTPAANSYFSVVR